MMTHYCGMDFGTSNSTVGVVTSDGIQMVGLEQLPGAPTAELTLPSAIFFPFEHDDISFGRAAIGEYTEGERGRLMRSMKSILGTPLMTEQTNIKGRLHGFTDIIGYFIRHLKSRADAQVSVAQTAVVMGRPVRFSDDDAALDQAAESLLADIARQAGFRDVSFQYEPIAAAYDYESRLTRDEVVLIVDIGGGTSDFSIVQLRGEPAAKANANRSADILANHGVHIGGTDFDQRLSMQTAMPFLGLHLRQRNRPELSMPHYFYSDFSTWHRIHNLYELETVLNLKSFQSLVTDPKPIARFLRAVEQKQGHAIAAAVEFGKIALSSESETTIDLSLIESASTSLPDYWVAADQATLRAAIVELLQRLDESIRETLLLAGVRAEQVDTVFLTGGSTALPAIQQLINQQFDHAKQINTDLFCAVGRGLAIEAQRRYG